MLINIARYRSSRPIIVLAVLLTFLLAACGTPSNSTGSSSGATVTSTPAPTATHSGTTSSATGCPNKTTVAQPAAASVVLNSSGVDTKATVKKGDLVEIDLPFGHNWSGPGNSAQGSLVEQNPSGYASPTGHVCVWRFLATGTGTAEVNFTGRPICQKDQVCPMYIMDASFTIEIQ